MLSEKMPVLWSLVSLLYWVLNCEVEASDVREDHPPLSPDRPDRGSMGSMTRVFPLTVSVLLVLLTGLEVGISPLNELRGRFFAKKDRSFLFS
jgi:hypothetical protein